MVAYMYEHHNQLVRSLPEGAVIAYNADVVDNVNTVMAAVNWEAIPDRLN